MSAAGPSRTSAAANGTPNSSQTNIPISTSDSENLKNAESNFPQAAIITISVVGGLVALFVLYKFYRWVYTRSQHLRASYTAPPSPSMMSGRNPLLSPNTGGMTQAGGFGAAAAGGSAGRGQFSRMSSYQSMDKFGSQYPSLGAASTRSSMFALDVQGGAMSPGISDGSITSPLMNGSVVGGGQHPYLPRAVIRGNSNMSTDVLRAQGSRSSLLYPMTQQNAIRDRRSTMPTSHSQYSSTGSTGSSYGNPNNGSTPSLLSPFSNSANNTPRRPRVSGPHARHSRVEIVPPTPLAPPPGTVVATDKTTLAFSSLSGIGAEGSVMGLSGFTTNDPTPPGSAGPSDDASSLGGSKWFNTPLAGSEVDLERIARAGGQSGPASTSSGQSSNSSTDLRKPGSPTSAGRASSEGHSASSLPQSPIEQRPVPQQGHSRAFSAATTASSAHFSDDSSLAHGNTSPVPPLPQSPLDKLKLELQGEARRVERRSASSASGSSKGETDVKGKGKERQISGILSAKDVERYRNGEGGPKA